MRVRIPENAEPAFGMAALVHAGDGPVAPVAARLSRTAQLFEPDEHRSATLLQSYERLLTELVERNYIAAGAVAGIA